MMQRASIQRKEAERRRVSLTASRKVAGREDIGMPRLKEVIVDCRVCSGTLPPQQ